MSGLSIKPSPKSSCLDTIPSKESTDIIHVYYDDIIDTLRYKMIHALDQFALNKLEGLHNYDAWLSEYKRWVDSQDECIKHYVSGKLGTGPIDASVKGHYARLLEIEIRKLKSVIDKYLCLILKNNVDSSKIPVVMYHNYYKLWEQIRIAGEFDPIDRQIAELKSYYRSLKGCREYHDHLKIWPQPNDWKIEWMARLFSPYNYSDRSLGRLFQTLNDSDLDKKYKECIERESMVGAYTLLVVDKLVKLCTYELDLKIKKTKHKKDKKLGSKPTITRNPQDGVPDSSSTIRYGNQTRLS